MVPTVRARRAVPTELGHCIVIFAAAMPRTHIAWCFRAPDCAAMRVQPHTSRHTHPPKQATGRQNITRQRNGEASRVEITCRPTVSSAMLPLAGSTCVYKLPLRSVSVLFCVRALLWLTRRRGCCSTTCRRRVSACQATSTGRMVPVAGHHDRAWVGNAAFLRRQRTVVVAAPLVAVPGWQQPLVPSTPARGEVRASRLGGRSRRTTSSSSGSEGAALATCTWRRIASTRASRCAGVVVWGCSGCNNVGV